MKLLPESVKRTAIFLGRQILYPYIRAGQAVGTAAKSIRTAGKAIAEKKRGVRYAVDESELPPKPTDGSERFEWYMQLHGTTAEGVAGLLARYNLSRRIALVVSCVSLGFGVLVGFLVKPIAGLALIGVGLAFAVQTIKAGYVVYQLRERRIISFRRFLSDPKALTGTVRWDR